MFAISSRQRLMNVPGLRRYAGTIGALVCLAGTLQGQVTTGSAQPPVATAPLPRLLLPGDTLLKPLLVTRDSVRYALTVFRDADEIPVGRLAETLRADTVNGVPVVRRVLRIQRGTMLLVDSTMLDARTLAPRQRRSLQQNRRVLLEFNGAHIKGSLAPLDAPPVPFDTTFKVVPFDAGNWELILRALPLERGFAVRFPVYDLDGGLREYRVNVTGSTTVQGEEAHVVILTLARNRESVVWVSKQTGIVLQIETMLGETTMLRQVRVRE
jgi:hypothetical protein